MDVYSMKQINKKKVIGVIIFLIVLTIVIAISTILGINKSRKEYALEVERKIQLEEQNKILEEERITKIKEEEERKRKEQELKEKENKLNRPLTEAEKERILHIYKSTGTKRAFLTFDDGPSNNVTPLVLDVLKEENVKATFFVLGNNVKYYPKVVKRAFDEGHYIANHGYTHKYSKVYASPEATLEEYNFTETAIKEALGNNNYSSKIFRFPGGSNGGYYDAAKQRSKALLRENGIVHLDWNALNEDAAGSYTKEQLLENVIKTVGEKDSVVILMHDNGDKILTYEMLRDLIKYLKEKGYEFQNMYDLLDK